MNITLEDALMSFESMRLMMGGNLVKPVSGDTKSIVTVSLTEQAAIAVANTVPTLYDHLDSDVTYDLTGKAYRYVNFTTGVKGSIDPEDETSTFTAAVGDIVRFFWEEKVTQESADGFNAYEITISPNTFPGTYKVVGDTFIRSEKTGKDEAFQFVIGKAKVLSNVTITLQAEGDPSTFEMQLNVLRSTNERGEYEMMKLIRYGGQPA